MLTLAPEKNGAHDELRAVSGGEDTFAFSAGCFGESPCQVLMRGMDAKMPLARR
jgi:hypothetical protein